ncbi:MAG: SAM-dependent methyltransferase [Acidimicrobiales bacterium]
MHKSSIYLPDDLKRSLTATAAASGRSEADLIRHAIEHLLAVSSRPATSSRPVDVGAPTNVEQVDLDVVRPMLVGVGTGPGDPALVTRRADALLRTADRVLVVTTDDRSIGRAEAVVRAVAPLAVVQRVAYRIGAGDDRAASMQHLLDAALAGVDAGELVAVAVLGDPSQWTVFPELAERVRVQRPALRVVATPGITAYQAAAARQGVALGEGPATLVITSDPSRARAAIEVGDAVVLHKATTDGETIRDLVAGTGRTDAVVAEQTGQPGERVRPAADTPNGPLAYLSALIAPHRMTVEARR